MVFFAILSSMWVYLNNKVLLGVFPVVIGGFLIWVVLTYLVTVVAAASSSCALLLWTLIELIWFLLIIYNFSILSASCSLLISLLVLVWVRALILIWAIARLSTPLTFIRNIWGLFLLLFIILLGLIALTWMVGWPLWKMRRVCCSCLRI